MLTSDPISMEGGGGESSRNNRQHFKDINRKGCVACNAFAAPGEATRWAG